MADLEPAGGVRPVADKGAEALGVGGASLSVGAVLTALLGAACCTGPLLGPLVVAAFGVSGAAALAGVKPYTPYLLVGSLVLLGVAFWSVYRPAARCATDPGAVRRRGWVRAVLWVAAIFWMAAVGLTLAALRSA
jgi:mercuric ion transport protein